MPSTSSRSAVLPVLAALVTLAALAGCGVLTPDDGAGDADGDRSRPPVATLRALTAVTIVAGLAGAVGSIGAVDLGVAGFVTIEVDSGNGAVLVVREQRQEDGGGKSGDLAPVLPCDELRPARGAKVVSCEFRDGEQRTVVSDPANVTVQVLTDEGAVRVEVGAPTKAERRSALAYARRLLADERFGYRTTPEAIAAGNSLEGYQDTPLVGPDGPVDLGDLASQFD